MTDAVETMAYKGEIPWHRKGHASNPDANVDEMLVDAGLNWDILREKIFTRVGDKEILIHGRRAMVRSSDNKIMTIAGQDWKPRQNKELVSFFKDYCDAGALDMDTIGSLRGGTVVWGMAKLRGGTFTVGKSDVVYGNLLFIMPHTVGTTDKILCTPVRVVCANTMAAALDCNVMHYTQNHTRAFDVEAAKEMVEKAHDSLRAAGKRAQALHKLKLSVSDRLTFLGKFFEKKQLTEEEVRAIIDSEKSSTLKAVNVSIEKGPGAEPGTAWGVYNGYTHWADHVNGRKEDTRLFRSWVGDISREKARMEKELFELAQ